MISKIHEHIKCTLKEVSELPKYLKHYSNDVDVVHLHVYNNSDYEYCLDTYVIKHYEKECVHTTCEGSRRKFSFDIDSIENIFKQVS